MPPGAQYPPSLRLEHRELGGRLARLTAYERQGGVCLACRRPMSPDAFEAHHRVRRAHMGWCPCNIVALHPRCHTMGAGAVHDHPEWARACGLIVPAVADPRQVPVYTVHPWSAWVWLLCDGTLETASLAPGPALLVHPRGNHTEDSHA